MNKHQTPSLSEDLYRRIRLVRRDIGTMLFHFTRRLDDGRRIEIVTGENSRMSMSGTARGVLEKILYDGRLIGTTKWTYGYPCVSFTEAPIQEFNSIFSLVELASAEDERPRYEPYGIAVTKEWLFEHGGRPVIYDHPDSFDDLPESLQYRFVPYDPLNGIDFTWEREWRVKSESLQLDPKHTLVILPTSEEAFELVYGFSEEVPDWNVEGSTGPAYIIGSYHEPKWLAVSLDLFGYKHGRNGA